MEVVPAGPSAPRLCEACKDAKLPLHRAASKGHLGCLQAALRRVPDPRTALDEYGNNALHAAALFGHINTLRYLLEVGAIRVESRNGFGETVVHLAAQRGRLPLLKFLLGGPLRQAEHLAVLRDEAGCTGLHAAVLVGEEETARWLLQRFGSALAVLPNHRLLTPLHIAAGQGAIELIRTATKYDAGLVSARDTNGATPAFYAVQGGHLESLRYLIEKAKGDPRALTRRGQSLLHAACLGGQGRIVEWLSGRIDKSAVFQETAEGATPAHCAAFGGSTALLDLLAEWVGKSGLGKMVKARDARGNTLLHLATLNGHPDTVAYLLSKGSSPTLKNKGGHSPLDIAEAQNRPDLRQLLKNASKGKGKEAKGWRRRSLSTSANSPLGYQLPIYGSGPLVGSPVSSGPRSSGYGSAENLIPPLSPIAPLQKAPARAPEGGRLFGRGRRDAAKAQRDGDPNWILRPPIYSNLPRPLPILPSSSQGLVYATPFQHLSWKERGNEYGRVGREAQTEPDALRDNVVVYQDDQGRDRRTPPIDAGYGYVTAVVGKASPSLGAESVYSEPSPGATRRPSRPYDDASVRDAEETLVAEAIVHRADLDLPPVPKHGQRKEAAAPSPLTLDTSWWDLGPRSASALNLSNDLLMPARRAHLNASLQNLASMQVGEEGGPARIGGGAKAQIRRKAQGGAEADVCGSRVSAILHSIQHGEPLPEHPSVSPKYPRSVWSSSRDINAARSLQSIPTQFERDESRATYI